MVTEGMLDIFSTLTRYGLSSEENYLTESFVFLIKLILGRQPETGLRLLHYLCDLPISLLARQKITLTTQVTLENGRPDIEIKVGNGIVVFVEVKHDSPLGEKQLERYKNELLALNVQETRLVFLTRLRIAAQWTSLPDTEFHHVCWYNIYQWLCEVEVTDEICGYFIQAFLAFLDGKSMNVNKVTWEYMKGMPALFNLMNMIKIAITELNPNLKIRRTAGWSWRGYYLNSSLWCGVRYDEPLKIVFENNQGNNPTYRRELDLEQAHFFSLSQGEQLECIATFIQQSWLETPEEQRVYS